MRRLGVAASCCVVAWPLAGCRQDMHDQPQVQAATRRATSSPTSASARPLVAGTVARGQLREDDALFTRARRAARLADDVPVPGRRRRCCERGPRALRHLLLALPRPAPGAATAWSCSAATGSRRRSTSTACAAQPVGYFFDVITNGFGAMPDYAAQIPVEDRWAIVAYVRALQLSQHATARRRAAPERARPSCDAPPRRRRRREAHEP